MDKSKKGAELSAWQIQCADVSRKAAAAAFHISDKALMSSTRCRAHIALARQVAMYLCHVTCSVPMQATANAFGRDRTTVSHACRIVENRRDDQHFDLLMEQLDARIKRTLDNIIEEERLPAPIFQKDIQQPLLYAATGTNGQGSLEVKIIPYQSQSKKCSNLIDECQNKCQSQHYTCHESHKPDRP